MWLKNALRTPNCPVCRANVKKNQLERDLLASNLINELEIFCTNKGCTWKGPLEEITSHMPQCAFQEGKLPLWYVNYMKSKESEIMQQENEEELLVSHLMGIHHL